MASKQKVKKKKDCMIPSSDSYKGLSYEDWEALNDGQAVELDEVSDTLINNGTRRTSFKPKGIFTGFQT